MHDHLLYLMFRCDFDVMESLESLEKLKGSEHSLDVTTINFSMASEGFLEPRARLACETQ